MTLRERLILAAMILALAAPAVADEAADAFNALYGEELKRATATPFASDDIALAKRLLADAEAVGKQPALVALLCEKACELGMKDPAGHATALAAIDLLIEKVPAARLGALQKRAALYQRQYAAARGEAKTKVGESLVLALVDVSQALVAKDDLDGAATPLRQAQVIAAAINSPSKPIVQAEAASQAARQKMEKQIGALKARLAADPKDAAARKELVRMYLAEKNDPAAAAKFVDESLDEATRRYVPAAARPIAEVPELACMELAKWYQALAGQDPPATPAGKAILLGRAKAYYERFVVLHTSEDLTQAAAALAIKNIGEALKKLGPAAPEAAKPPATAWVDCLKLVDLKKDVQWGVYAPTPDGALVGQQGRAVSRMSFRAAPTESYEFEAIFARTAGSNMVSFAFPVGASAVALQLGHYSGASGLADINGSTVENSPVRVSPGTIVNGKDYLLNVAVVLRGEEAAIAVKLDSRPYLQWRGPVRFLSCALQWRAPRDTGITLYTQDADVTLRRLRMRAITGEVKVPPPAPPADPTQATQPKVPE